MHSTNGIDLEKKESTSVYTTPKDFFMNLGAVVALYVSAISLINLLFQVINYAFPDNLDYYVDPYSSGARWAIAMLIVFFPIFLVITRLVNKEIVAVPEKKNSGFRKIITYLTLFVAGLVVAIDLVAIVNSFLGGEITTRFILKALVIFVVAGIIFGYYLFDLRRTVGLSEKKMALFAYGTVVLILISLIMGFLVMGSPATARKMRFDERRIADLNTIQWQVGEYWRFVRVLPESFEVLGKDALYNFTPPRDPNTGEPYEYQKTGEFSFVLCATFDLPSVFGKSVSTPKFSLSGDGNWEHEAGRTCFDRTIDPDRYPETEKYPIPVR